MQLRYCAAVSAELTYRDMLDKINDSCGLRKLFYRMSLPALRRAKKKAGEAYKFDEGYVTSALEKLSRLEAEKTPSPDRAADAFGEALEYFFSYGLPEGKKQSAAEIGRNTGRFIYVADAADDIEKDEKSGAYNPLLLSEGETEEKLNRVFCAMCVWADTAAGELMLEGRPSPEADVAVNILKLGMPDAAKKTTEKRGKDNGKRSV